MKKYKVICSCLILALCACNNGNTTVSESPNKQAKAANIITKNIPIGTRFTHLTSVSGANIEYTQGDYAMEIEGDSAVIQHLEANFDANLLTISIGSERNPDLNVYEGKQNVTIRISAPELQCVSLCSSGDFTSHGTWRGERIELGIIGAGQFKCDSIECKTFDIQSTGRGKAEFAHIKAESTHFASTNSSAIRASIDTDLLMAENQGTNDIILTGRADKKEIYQTKKGKITLE